MHSKRVSGPKAILSITNGQIGLLEKKHIAREPWTISEVTLGSQLIDPSMKHSLVV